MRRRFLLLILILIPVPGLAQVSDVVVSVVDRNDFKPVAGASVYLVHLGDSTVFNYSITDNNGRALLRGVPAGSYLVNTEFLGYSKQQRKLEVSGQDAELDTIFLEKISEKLLPAIIRAAVKPVEFKQDTIVYNVSYFNVGHNYLLIDLLKAMPGIKIDGNKVSVNGRNVSRITFGGRTFFFDDLSIALNNIPADMVGRITVVDKPTPINKFTGIAGRREQVLDVELKKEYQNGIFGNVTAGLGLDPGKAANGAPKEKRNLLYTGRALLSAYNDKDQITLIGNADNFKEENSRKQSNGLSSTQQAAANYNTTRVKGTETTVVTSYKHSLTELESRKGREAFDINEHYLNTQESRSSNADNSETTIVLQSDNIARERFYFSLKENLSLSNRSQLDESSARNEDFQHSVSGTSSKETVNLNRLSSHTSLTAGYNSRIKEGRSFMFDGIFGYSTESADSRFESRTSVHKEEEFSSLDFSYDISGRRIFTSLNARYVEPINPLFKAITSVEYMTSAEKEERYAYDSTGWIGINNTNGRISSSVDARTHLVQESLGLQYGRKRNSVQIGAKIYQALNENLYNAHPEAAGKDSWTLYCSPYANIKYKKGRSGIQITCSSNLEQPLQYQLRPAIELTGFPVVTIGNVYLRPSMQRSLLVYYTLNGSKDWEYVSIWGEISSIQKDMVNVDWFDDNGTTYQVPVNAESPTRSARLDISWSKPLSSNLTLEAFARCTYYGKDYYQMKSSSRKDIIEDFEYSRFMEQFWGKNLAGDIFHSEKSLFIKDRMMIIKPAASLSISYEGEHFRFSCEEYVSNTLSRHYDSAGNENLWDYVTVIESIWKTNSGLEITADSYDYFYSGYPEGFGKPRCIIDLMVSKKMSRFVLGLKVNNILNQNNLLRHTIGGNYTESIYSNCLGRYILLSAKYTFGITDQSKRKKADQSLLPLR